VQKTKDPSFFNGFTELNTGNIFYINVNTCILLKVCLYSTHHADRGQKYSVKFSDMLSLCQDFHSPNRVVSLSGSCHFNDVMQQRSALVMSRGMKGSTSSLGRRENQKV